MGCGASVGGRPPDKPANEQATQPIEGHVAPVEEPVATPVVAEIIYADVIEKKVPGEPFPNNADPEIVQPGAPPTSVAPDLGVPTQECSGSECSHFPDVEGSSVGSFAGTDGTENNSLEAEAAIATELLGIDALPSCRVKFHLGAEEVPLKANAVSPSTEASTPPRPWTGKSMESEADLIDLFDERDDSADKAVITEIESLMTKMEYGLTNIGGAQFLNDLKPFDSRTIGLDRPLSKDDELLMQHILEDIGPTTI